MKFFAFAVFAFSVGHIAVAAVPPPCVVAASPGAQLAAYVIELEQDGDLDARHLQSLLDDSTDLEYSWVGIERSLSTQPFTLEHLRERLFELTSAQRGAFRSHLSLYLNRRQQLQLEQNLAEIKTSVDVSMVRVRAGVINVFSVALPKSHSSLIEKSVEEELRRVAMDYDLDVMSTHVTYQMFEDVFGWELNREMSLSNEKSNDEPIWKSTILMAMRFANEYSKSLGLEPVYQLPDDLDWKEVHGNTVLVGGAFDLPLTSLVRDVSGVPVERLGFRLPKRSEWEFILGSIQEMRPDLATSDQGRRGVLRFHRNGEYQAYWGSIHESSQIYDVASYRAFPVRGSPIYDLYGLNPHWIHPEPSARALSATYSITGSIYDHSLRYVTSSFHSQASMSSVEPSGFRLVREVPR